MCKNIKVEKRAKMCKSVQAKKWEQIFYRDVQLIADPVQFVMAMMRLLAMWLWQRMVTNIFTLTNIWNCLPCFHPLDVGVEGVKTDDKWVWLNSHPRREKDKGTRDHFGRCQKCHLLPCLSVISILLSPSSSSSFFSSSSSLKFTSTSSSSSSLTSHPHHH